MTVASEASTSGAGGASTHWIFKNREHGKTSATASIGMITMWDVEGGLPQVRGKVGKGERDPPRVLQALSLGVTSGGGGAHKRLRAGSCGCRYSTWLQTKVGTCGDEKWWRERGAKGRQLRRKVWPGSGSLGPAPGCDVGISWVVPCDSGLAVNLSPSSLLLHLQQGLTSNLSRLSCPAD